MRLDAGIAIPLVILVVAAAVAAWLLSGAWLVGGSGRADAAPISLTHTGQRSGDWVLTAAQSLRLPALSPAAAVERSNVRQVAQADELAAFIAARRDEIYSDPDTPVAGNPQGDVAIVEFFDYNCPYCRAVAPVLAELLRGDPNLRLVYKEFPILGPDSTFAARAALAAHQQDKYLEFHEAMMTGRGVASESTVRQIARLIGLDLPRLEADMEDPAIDAILARNLALARALQMRGTPSFIIADKVSYGAAELADFQEAIAAARSH